jgi:glycosyltransferase involved in cell wall biosynthesis
LEGEVTEAAAKDNRIDFRGYLSHGDVLLLYKSADLLINLRLTKVLNTQYFFPSKLMEYLASGTPVISTCTGHVEEEFGQYLYVLKEETPAALAELILRILSLTTEQRYRRAADAKEYISRHKTWDAQGRRVARFLESLTAAERAD